MSMFLLFFSCKNYFIDYRSIYHYGCCVDYANNLYNHVFIVIIIVILGVNQYISLFSLCFVKLAHYRHVHKSFVAINGI